jgi:hypothetical protein
LETPAQPVDVAAENTAQGTGSTGSFGPSRRRLLQIERRWAEQALAAFAPDGGTGLVPQPGEVDYATAFHRMLQEVTPWAALGLRLGLWLVALAPLWLWQRARTIGSLAVGERPALLRALLVHRVFAVRELTLLLKLCAAMALLGAPSVRARSGYDRVQEAESGVRLRLPKAREHAALAVFPANEGAPQRVSLPREAS